MHRMRVGIELPADADMTPIGIGRRGGGLGFASVWPYRPAALRGPRPADRPGDRRAPNRRIELTSTVVNVCWHGRAVPHGW